MSIGASPMMSNFPMGFADGVTLRNFPITPIYGGRVFFVSNSTVIPPGCAAGSDNNRGTWQRPFATIAGALAQCLANRGDIVFVKQGHAEVLSTATQLALSVAGVQVIGLGIGAARPTLTLGTVVGTTISVTGAQMALRNFFIDMTGLDAITTGFTISAADFQLTDCKVKTATAAAQATCALTTTAAASGLLINGNKFLGTSDAGMTSALLLIGGDDIQVTNNYFQGAYTAGTGAVSNTTTAITNMLLAGNYINNLTAASTKGATFVAGTTGLASDNRCQLLSGSAWITAAGMSWVGANYAVGTIATVGVLV